MKVETSLIYSAIWNTDVNITKQYTWSQMTILADNVARVGYWWNKNCPYWYCLAIPNWTNCKSSLKQPKQVGSWWKFHRSFSWMLSQTRPNHTIPYQTLPIQTNCISSLKKPKQIRSWWKFHRSFRLMFSQTIHNQTKPYQTNSKSSLKPPNQVRSWWNFQRSFRWMLPQTKPNHTEPNQILSVSLSLIVETKCYIS